MFLFYTDGVSEAMNYHRQEFSEERLLDIISNSNHQTCLQIRQEIVKAVNNFVKEAPQHDDITIVTLKAT
jgi:sigma-B regulation protein RsbU (phosphoserine phosphatase)